MLWLLNLSLNRRVNLTDVKASWIQLVQIIVCNWMLLKFD